MEENRERSPYYVTEAVFREGYPGIHVESTFPIRPRSYVLVQVEEKRREVLLTVSRSVPLPLAEGTLPRVLRMANRREIRRFRENLEFERKAEGYCRQFAADLGLAMKLVRVERFFDRSKVIFYYTAEGRIDFRELVKQLVRALRTRIEMRQIGVRNETAMCGGLAACGRELCCAAFLKQFAPISIKMAKEQSLPLDPEKISGLCGRLLCCLLYEYQVYQELSQSLPKIGKKIQTPAGPCRVVRYNIFRQTVVLENQEGREVEIPAEELREILSQGGAA
ncbi:regulatory iron-sulfur-containing complex subunit RicT [Thermosulfurimonas sp. F29]|uniref:PSP1 domain-containing protein n=1 Tax=Thermosulfurimonas sp. F29 TaxID=2867247 RepID=UPI001C83284A|nr:regulatory iron-sulfur-containing complex subunit RicT [Thermosulfurimonas sp. F29]MBX6422647.1 stage 0 sporulation protein [Thermosulfurimonas sp. F29]